MLGLVLAAMMQAGAPAAPPSAITNPDWLRIPTPQDVGRYYPKAAFKEDLAGRAVVTCSVNADGRLVSCRADGVTPDGAGFAEAALAMTVVLRMRPQSVDGRPVAGGVVRVPLTFIIPATLRASAVTTRHAEVRDQVVELDCRFKDRHLDNCFPRGGAGVKASEVAVKLAAEVTLPPTPVRQGRIVLPLIFASAAGAATVPEMVTRPRWVETPNFADIGRAYPDAARKRRVLGEVVLECGIDAEGRLVACAPTSESPGGEGFGEGALRLAPKFRMQPADSFGLKVEGRKIRIPMRFSPGPPPRRGTG